MMDIKKSEIGLFLTQSVSAVNTLRTLVLFGKNTATYKFALCDALLNQSVKSEVAYQDLRDDFLTALIKHYQSNPYQFQSGSNKLTKAFDQYVISAKTDQDWQQLTNVAEKQIYNNVFDAFQNVGGGSIDKHYQLFEHNKKNKCLVLTDNIHTILENDEYKNAMRLENQSRWRIVEEAWRAGLSPNLLDYDSQTGEFTSVNIGHRVNLRSAIDVLMPYQHGQCFYCKKRLNRFTDSMADDFPDVDHVLPLSLLVKTEMGKVNPNGVWNLVLACMDCNRGQGGKFDAIPAKQFLVRLAARNALFVEEHKHSLRNSILISLDVTDKKELLNRMREIYNRFQMFTGWQPRHGSNTAIL